MNHRRYFFAPQVLQPLVLGSAGARKPKFRAEEATAPDGLNDPGPEGGGIRTGGGIRDDGVGV